MRVADRGEAERWLRRLRRRVTRARVVVLGVLLGAEQSLTHQQIESQLSVSQEQMDSVTLYRVLDWLVENGLAHRVAGADRAWRFAVVRDHMEERSDDDRMHPHFHCILCDQVICLPTVEWGMDSVRLPAGFTPKTFNLMVEGCCAACRSIESAERGEHGAQA